MEFYTPSYSDFKLFLAMHLHPRALQGLLKGPGLYPAIHWAPQCSPMLLRGRDPFSTWAAPKLKNLELLSMGELTAKRSVGGAEQTSPEEELMDLTATAPSQGGSRGRRKGSGHKGACCSCCTKPGGQGQGSWVGRLSEPMEVSEETTDEIMEGGGEFNQ
eukprot:1161501-Pelagomonas_calceolata.AAC.6